MTSSYQDNGMADLISRKQAKYERQRKDKNKQHDRFIDLTEQVQEPTDGKTLKASVSNDVPLSRG